jgi:hypothetical protein
MLGKTERRAAEAVIRVVGTGQDMQMSQPIPGIGWWKREAIPRSSRSLTVGQLQTLAGGPERGAFRTGLCGFRGRAGARRQFRSKLSATACAVLAGVRKSGGPCARWQRPTRACSAIWTWSKAVELVPILLSAILSLPNRHPRWSQGEGGTGVSHGVRPARLQRFLGRLRACVPKCRRARERPPVHSKNFEEDDDDVDLGAC